jgi:hypothetical protein
VDSARSRGRIGPFIVGVLIGLVCGVLLVWSGIMPNPLASGSAPTKGTPPPVAQGGKANPEKGKNAPPEGNTEGSAQSTQPPEAQFLCLQRKASDAEGRDAVRQLLTEEASRQGVIIPTNIDVGPINQLLRDRGYSCSDAEIEPYASKVE